MLRVMWKLSFIKLDYEENAALQDVLLRANRQSIPREGASEGSWTQVHADIAIRRTSQNDLQLAPMLSAVASQSVLRSEKAIEAAFLYYLTNGDAPTTQVFGDWDYVSHQVAASPFKPPDWMDKIDVFKQVIPNHAPVLAGLLVAELKKDVANGAFVEQTMKYVDWVKDEYAHLDYSLVRRLPRRKRLRSIRPSTAQELCGSPVYGRSKATQERGVARPHASSLRVQPNSGTLGLSNSGLRHGPSRSTEVRQPFKASGIPR